MPASTPVELPSVRFVPNHECLGRQFRLGQWIAVARHLRSAFAGRLAKPAIRASSTQGVPQSNALLSELPLFANLSFEGAWPQASLFFLHLHFLTSTGAGWLPVFHACSLDAVRLPSRSIP